MNFADLPDHLTTLTKAAGRMFASIDEAVWRAPYVGSSGWTRSELLGHLTDSAINNQQRIARALIEEELQFPSYPQNDMVRVQNYREAPVELLTGLWTNLNLHLGRLLRHVPPGKLGTRCQIGNNPAMTLEQLALDYVAHMEHHLKHLLGKDALAYSDLAWPPPDRWQNAAQAPPR